MSKHYYSTEIVSKLMESVNELSSSLGLKVIANGGLELLPAPKDLDEWLNAIIFSMRNTSTQWGSLANTYTVTYTVTVWALRRFLETENIEEEQQAFSNAIAENLLGCSKLLELNSEGLRINTALITNISLENEADSVFRELCGNVSVTEITLEIETTVKR